MIMSHNGCRKRNNRSKAGNNKSLPSETPQASKVRDNSTSHQKSQHAQKPAQTNTGQSQQSRCQPSHQTLPSQQTQPSQQSQPKKQHTDDQQQKQQLPTQLTQLNSIFFSFNRPDTSVCSTTNPESANPAFKPKQNPDGNASLKRKTSKPSPATNITLHSAIFWRRRDIVETMLQNGAKPWEVDQQGNTAFMTACRMGDLSLMNLLWNAAGSKLDIDHANKDGDTVLHLCATAGHEEGCRFLLDKSASVKLKNNYGNNVLHVAAKGDHVTICNMLLNVVMRSNDGYSIYHYILENNGLKQTAICLALIHQRAQITRLLLDLLTAYQQSTYLTDRLWAVADHSHFDMTSPWIQDNREVFLHGLLISVSILLIRLAEKSRQLNVSVNKSERLDYCLTNTEIIQTLVKIACGQYTNKQIVPIACLLIIYLIEGFSQKTIQTSDGGCDPTWLKNDKALVESKNYGDHFLAHFISCNGASDFIMTMNRTETSCSNEAIIMISLSLPVVTLVRSTLGKTWLESNKCHLTFLKETILQNRPILTLLTTACPLLPLSYIGSVSQEFVSFAEVIEAKDREQNLAELLWEEERDRKRRERKKQKQQSKKQQDDKENLKGMSRQTLEISEVCSDDETSDVMSDPSQRNDSQVLRSFESKEANMGCDDGSNLQQNVCSLDVEVSFLMSSEVDATKENDTENLDFTPHEFSGPNNDYLDIGKSRGKSKKIKKLQNSATLENSSMKRHTSRAECSAMRWADVAKLGCNILDKSCNSGIASTKSTICKQSTRQKEQEQHALLNILPGQVVDQSVFETTWFKSPLQNIPQDHSNSDEGESSSCSVSSLESSMCSLASDSCVHNTPGKTQNEIDFDGLTVPVSTAQIPSNRRDSRKRRKGRLTRKALDEQRVFASHPSKVEAIEINASETESIAITIGDPLPRTKSDNILSVTPKSISKRGECGCHKYESIDSPVSGIKSDKRWRDITAVNLKIEAPKTLPPLKSKEGKSIEKHHLRVGNQESTKGNNHRDVDKDLKSTESNYAKYNFSNRNTPLASIKTGAAQYDAGMPDCHSFGNDHVLNLSHCHVLPLSTTQCSSSHRPHSAKAPPPPGFHSFIEDSNIAGDHNGHHETKTNHACGKKRVISTILLDKVKNPPLSLQQKVPSLSALAWNCGQESKVNWSNVLQAEPTISSLSTSVSVDGCNGEGRELGQRVPCVNTSTDASALLLCGYDSITSGGTNPCMQHSEHNVHASPSFSNILINRIQQRSYNRNSLSAQPAVSVPDTDYVAGTTTPSAFATDVPASTTSTFNPFSTFTTRESATVQQKLFTKVDVQMTSKDTDMSKPCSYTASRQDDSARRWFPSDTPVYKRTSSPCYSECRGNSPMMFPPEKIRDDNNTLNTSSPFPGFHDAQTSDFLSEMFSDPLYSDNIAINQIRQKIISSHFNQNSQSEVAGQAQESCDIDLDYYASLYQMKFRDVLGNLQSQTQSCFKSILNKRAHFGFHAPMKENGDWPGHSNSLGTSTFPNVSHDMPNPRRHSVRWNRTLQKILDLPWTTRRQCGSIILPHPVPEFSFGMAGNVLILLGFLMDGTEVATLIIDKVVIKTIPRIIEVMSRPEIDTYFLAPCRSFSDSSNVQYIAMDLYEYTLCEYLQLYLPTCNQNSDTYISLAWQLLQALCFLHHRLGVPHGSLSPCWIFINSEGQLRLASFGLTPTGSNRMKCRDSMNSDCHGGYEYRTNCWGSVDDFANDRVSPSFYNDIRVAGKLAYFILTKGHHLFGAAPFETEINLMRDRISTEAFDLISPMLTPDVTLQPTVDQCLKHPIFWSGDKKFRLILIVGSDVLTEMKTGVALTGTGGPTMMEILSLIDINAVSPNWIHEVDSTVLKEMRSFRVYKNNLAELTLFVYNCCLHFDKLSNTAKEVLDDPCKYFQNRFPGLFMAIFRSLKSSDRTERTCYKPFF